MYGCGVLMGIIDLILNNIFDKPYHYISNNIFVTLFIIGVIVWLKEYRHDNKEKGAKFIFIYIAYQIVTTIICGIVGEYVHLQYVSLFVGAITANLIFNEGTFIFVFLGVLMYFYKGNRKSITKAYVIFCMIYFILTACNGFSIEHLFMKDYQWMMIASLPFMLLYNGQRGRGLKYLFYVFYPVHIVVLFLIGNLYFR
jgi:hypothetical protein